MDPSTLTAMLAKYNMKLTPSTQNVDYDHRSGVSGILSRLGSNTENSIDFQTSHPQSPSQHSMYDNDPNQPTCSKFPPTKKSILDESTESPLPKNKMKKWNEAEDIKLLKEVIRARPFDHAKGTTLRAKAWEDISEKLNSEEGGMKTSQRSVRTRTNDVLKAFKKEEREEIRGSGIVPEFTEKKKLCCEIEDMERDSPALEEESKKKDMLAKKEKAIESRKRASAALAGKGPKRMNWLSPFNNWGQSRE